MGASSYRGVGNTACWGTLPVLSFDISARSSWEQILLAHQCWHKSVVNMVISQESAATEEDSESKQKSARQRCPGNKHLFNSGSVFHHREFLPKDALSLSWLGERRRNSQHLVSPLYTVCCSKINNNSYIFVLCEIGYIPDLFKDWEAYRTSHFFEWFLLYCLPVVSDMWVMCWFLKWMQSSDGRQQKHQVQFSLFA